MSSPQVFLMTGCSTGLGRELALAALNSGFRVIATARRVEKLAGLEERGAKALALDVTWSVSALAAFAAEAIALYGQVDYLVNNAGYGAGGAIEEVSADELLAQFNTNVFGLINTTNAFLPHFRARKSGTLVNFSSEASCIATPGAGAYGASKAAVNAISDTWAKELAEYNIRSICILPSAFRTDFFNNAGSVLPATRIEGYQVAHGVMDYMVSPQFTENAPGDPVKAAERIIKVVTKPGELLTRFAMGDDAYKNLKGFYEERIEELEAQRELTTGTNFDA
ncbi:short-chain dehydrogenase reductase sdr [Favolaschia claudopus]|uniref:Short-chain dehydrogenase reductase sdr n=1 Tax=Favolaschia claudopus TaxID=2862362 RepID=A0AAV9ZRC7_9AGAR